MTESPIASEIFDRLQQAMAVDPSALCELYRDYLADAHLNLLALRNAYARRDAEEFRYRAHLLKGSSLILGARSLAEICKSLEETGRTAQWDGCETSLADANAELEECRSDLARRLGATVLPVHDPTA